MFHLLQTCWLSERLPDKGSEVTVRESFALAEYNFSPSLKEQSKQTAQSSKEFTSQILWLIPYLLALISSGNQPPDLRDVESEDIKITCHIFNSCIWRTRGPGHLCAVCIITDLRDQLERECYCSPKLCFIFKSSSWMLLHSFMGYFASYLHG